MKYTILFTLASWALLSSVSVLSAQADPLVAQIDAYIVTTVPDQAEVLKLAEAANPGDIILYRATFENQGDAVLDAVKPIIPIPVGLAYVGGSAKPEPKEVSLDGTTFQAYPAVDAQGEPVAPSAYRALRWELSTLEADALFTAELRAKLLN
ncbi:hypothetical protein ACWPKO_03800 [Coraliomargarita sp. W4R53]